MINKSDTKWCARRALRAACQLGPWIAISLLLVAALGQVDSAALAGLFQSPEPATPTIEVTPTLTATIEATPTLTPTVEATASPEPTFTPPPTDTPAPTIEPAAAPLITATVAVDTENVEAGAMPVRGRYPDQGSNLEFDWPMLFDSMALAFSYAWLVCGALFMLLLPALFLAFWVAARRRRRRME